MLGSIHHIAVSYFEIAFYWRERKIVRCEENASYVISFNKFNYTRELMLDSIYYMILI